MLTSLSVDEILLLRHVNWSTNFRDLQLKEGDSSFLFKIHELCFICREQQLLDRGRLVTFGGARVVMVIVIGNGHSEMSSNPGPS